MKQEYTSKEQIMQSCRKIVAERGLAALNMRVLAKECGIAPATLYHFYSDKDELVIAATESVWRDIFGAEHHGEIGIPFPEYIGRMFRRIQRGMREYPNFLPAHSIAVAGSAKGKARGVMEDYFMQMRSELADALNADRNADHSIFSDKFTVEDLAEHVIDSILLLIMRGKTECTALTEMIGRLIYRNKKGDSNHESNL